MRKLLLIAAAAIMTLSCHRPKMLSSTSTEPVVIHSDYSKEQVWEKLIDYMATSGAAIKIIDKSSGLITTEEYSFHNSYTWEDKKGNVKDPNAFIVVKKEGGHPNRITGNWNVRIKDNPAGGSDVNVNIVNLNAYRIYKGEVNAIYVAGSSHVFENRLANYIGGK